MELQRIYKKAYLEYLRSNVKKEAYLQEHFSSDKKQTIPLADVYNNAEGLSQKMIPDANHDIDSAIALYETYPDLSPLLASQESLWVYLGHNELFEYVKKRRKVSEDSKEDKIKEYWFDDAERGTLSGLWWAVKMTINEELPDKYELTRTLFRNQTFRTRTFFTYKIGKHREALMGVLSFMNDNKDLFKGHEEARSIYVSAYFSRLGETKELAYLDKDFFYNELEKKRKAIELATDRDNVRHNHQIWNI